MAFPPMQQDPRVKMLASQGTAESRVSLAHSFIFIILRSNPKVTVINERMRISLLTWFKTATS